MSQHTLQSCTRIQQQLLEILHILRWKTATHISWLGNQITQKKIKTDQLINSDFAYWKKE
jgi:arabinogalactan endo-1,4-beta-galactosidase